MESYSIAEARDRFSSLVEAAENGEQIEITRYGRLVAVMSSPDRIPREQAPILTKKDFDELRAWRGQFTVDPGLNWAKEIREMRDED